MRKATCHESDPVRTTARVKGRAEAQVPTRGKAGGRMAWVTLSMLFLAALTGCERAKPPINQNQDSNRNQASTENQDRTKTQVNTPAVTPAVQPPRPAQPAAVETPVAKSTTQGSSASPEDAAELAVAPRDECSGLAGWPEFRAEITASMHARDAARFTALAAPDVQLD